MSHRPSTPPAPSPYLGETPSQSLRRKLPYYVFGLAIGCVLVGLMVMLRQMTAPTVPVAPAPLIDQSPTNASPAR